MSPRGSLRPGGRRSWLAMSTVPVLALVVGVGLSTGIVSVTSSQPLGAGGRVNQVGTRTGSVAGGTAFLGHLTFSGNTGKVTYVTIRRSADVRVTKAGVVTSPSTTQAGTFTASGSASDTAGDTGTWTFTLTVSAPTPTAALSSPTTSP